MLFVLAGTYREYLHFIRKQGLIDHKDTQYIGIGNEAVFRGYRGDQFIRIGTWFLRPDAERIFDMLDIMGFQEIESVRDKMIRNLVVLFNSKKSYVKRLDFG